MNDKLDKPIINEEAILDIISNTVIDLILQNPKKYLFKNNAKLKNGSIINMARKRNL